MNFVQVETIKQEIAKRGDAYAADLQKIIYNGKVVIIFIGLFISETL